MPAQQALAARAEIAIAGLVDDGLPDPQIFPVPQHGPSTSWPPGPPAPEEGQDRGGGPAVAGACRADLADGGQAWPRQFAVLLAEALAGVRPVRQLQPWLSERGRGHLYRLLPLFADGHRPRITRVLTARPSGDVIEMTLIVAVGPRTRALAVRLERTGPDRRPAGGEKPARQAACPRPGAGPQWHCTDIEAA